MLFTLMENTEYIRVFVAAALAGAIALYLNFSTLLSAIGINIPILLDQMLFTALLTLGFYILLKRLIK